VADTGRIEKKQTTKIKKDILRIVGTCGTDPE
jgi:hypothetical protein